MDDRQIEVFRVVRKFRKLLGHLNTIEWHQFMHYDQIWLMHRPTDDGLPSFGQFRKELKDAVGYSRQGSRLIRAFEELSVNTESEWAPAKAAAWSRFHEFCDYVGILRDHTAKPVLDSTPSVVIVPANRIADFDFSLCCDVDFEAFPEGSASFYECMRTGTCRTCGMPLTVCAMDTAVLNRVYRKCIVKARRIAHKPTDVPADVPADVGTELLKITDPDAHLFRDGDQWCDVKYAQTLGVSAKHIDRARKDGCYKVRLTDRRKASAKGQPYVYRRAELNELSDAIPDEHKYQPE